MSNGGLSAFVRRLLERFAQPAGTTPTPAASPLVDPTPSFPFPLVSVHGSDALTTWRRLRDEGKGWPLVLGDGREVERLLEGFEMNERKPAAIIAAADRLAFPQSLIDQRAEDDQRAREYFRQRGHVEEEEEDLEPPLGEWPDAVDASGFTLASDIRTGEPLPRVHIALLPCSNGWEAIAHLRWGGWNANPATEHHVAALRSWHDRFGAELVGAGADVLNLHVAIRPATRDAALALAREQHLYCADIVDQGVETLSALAATLMADDWWYFWWD